MTSDPVADRGMELVRQGQLQKLRAKLGLSHTAMAALLYVSPVTYKRWEQGDTDPSNMWTKTAERVARFHESAVKQLAWLEAEGFELDKLQPLAAYAAARGVGQEVLFRQYRNGELTAVDLGVLGLWVER